MRTPIGKCCFQLFVIFLCFLDFSTGRYHPSTSAQPAETDKCEVGPWSAWGNVNCHSKQRRRTRKYTHKESTGCKQILYEFRTVRIPNPIITAWSEWGQPDRWGRRKRSRRVVGVCASSIPLEETKYNDKEGYKPNQGTISAEHMNTVVRHNLKQFTKKRTTGFSKNRIQAVTKVHSPSRKLNIEPFQPMSLNLFDETENENASEKSVEHGNSSENEKGNNSEDTESKNISSKIKKENISEEFEKDKKSNKIRTNISDEVKTTYNISKNLDNNKTNESSSDIPPDAFEDDATVIMHSRVFKPIMNANEIEYKETEHPVNTNVGLRVLPKHHNSMNNTKHFKHGPAELHAPNKSIDNTGDKSNSKIMQLIIHLKNGSSTSISHNPVNKHIKTKPRTHLFGKTGALRRIYAQRIEQFKMKCGKNETGLNATYYKSPLMDEDGDLVSTTQKSTTEKSYWEQGGWLDLEPEVINNLPPSGAHGSNNSRTYGSQRLGPTNQLTDRSYGDKIETTGSRLSDIPRSYGSNVPAYGGGPSSSEGIYHNKPSVSSGRTYGNQPSYDDRSPIESNNEPRQTYGKQPLGSQVSYPSPTSVYGGSNQRQTYGSPPLNSDASYGNQNLDQLPKYWRQSLGMQGSDESQSNMPRESYHNPVPSYGSLVSQGPNVNKIPVSGTHESQSLRSYHNPVPSYGSPVSQGPIVNKLPDPGTHVSQSLRSYHNSVPSYGNPVSHGLNVNQPPASGTHVSQSPGSYHSNVPSYDSQPPASRASHVNRPPISETHLSQSLGSYHNPAPSYGSQTKASQVSHVNRPSVSGTRVHQGSYENQQSQLSGGNRNTQATYGRQSQETDTSYNASLRTQNSQTTGSQGSYGRLSQGSDVPYHTPLRTHFNQGAASQTSYGSQSQSSVGYQTPLRTHNNQATGSQVSYGSQSQVSDGSYHTPLGTQNIQADGSHTSYGSQSQSSVGYQTPLGTHNNQATGSQVSYGSQSQGSDGSYHTPLRTQNIQADGSHASYGSQSQSSAGYQTPLGTHNNQATGSQVSYGSQSQVSDGSDHTPLRTQNIQPDNSHASYGSQSQSSSGYHNPLGTHNNQAAGSQVSYGKLPQGSHESYNAQLITQNSQANGSQASYGSQYQSSHESHRTSLESQDSKSAASKPSYGSQSQASDGLYHTGLETDGDIQHIAPSKFYQASPKEHGGPYTSSKVTHESQIPVSGGRHQTVMNPHGIESAGSIRSYESDHQAANVINSTSRKTHNKTSGTYINRLVVSGGLHKTQPESSDVQSPKSSVSYNNEGLESAHNNHQSKYDQVQNKHQKSLDQVQSSVENSKQSGEHVQSNHKWPVNSEPHGHTWNARDESQQWQVNSEQSSDQTWNDEHISHQWPEHSQQSGGHTWNTVHSRHEWPSLDSPVWNMGQTNNNDRSPVDTNENQQQTDHGINIPVIGIKHSGSRQSNFNKMKTYLESKKDFNDIFSVLTNNKSNETNHEESSNTFVDPFTNQNSTFWK